MTLRMIDESSWQARTWTAARLKAAGVQVVAVKATEGTDYASGYDGWQTDQARSAGCVVMHYHLARYGSSQAEADSFARHLDGEGKLGDLVMLDNEANFIEALNPTAAAAWVSAFIKEIKRLTGAPAVIQYTSRDPITRGYFTGIREPLFLADPGASPKAPPIIPGWPVSFLQYTTRTDGGTVTDVDCAYFGTVGQLRKLAIPGPAPAPKPTPENPRRVVIGTPAPSLACLAYCVHINPSTIILSTCA